MIVAVVLVALTSLVVVVFVELRCGCLQSPSLLILISRKESIFSDHPYFFRLSFVSHVFLSLLSSYFQMYHVILVFVFYAYSTLLLFIGFVGCGHAAVYIIFFGFLNDNDDVVVVARHLNYLLLFT